MARCDGLDGPAIPLAARAPETGNVNCVLPWFQGQDESEARSVCDHALAVRKLGPEAKALADRHFFATLVRVHRAGEGAPFTGLKPAGRDLGPLIPAADAALEDGCVDKTIELVPDAIAEGARHRLHAARLRAGFAPDAVRAGREFVAAYVPYIHSVERLREDATGAGGDHRSAHAQEPGTRIERFQAARRRGRRGRHRNE